MLQADIHPFQRQIHEARSGFGGGAEIAVTRGAQRQDIFVATVKYLPDHRHVRAEAGGDHRFPGQGPVFQ